MKRRRKHSKNNVGPQVRKLRFLLGWSQTDFAIKLQLAGLDIDRSGVSKIEARMQFVDDHTLLYLADVLKVELSELFPKREPGRRIHDYVTQLRAARF